MAPLPSAIASPNNNNTTRIITICARTAFLLFMLPFSSAFSSSSSPVKLLRRCRAAAARHTSRAVADTALPRRPRVHPRRPLRLMDRDRDGSVFAIRTARLCSAIDAMATSGAPHAGPSASEDGVDGSEAKADEEEVDIDRLMGEEVADSSAAGAKSSYRQEYEELSTKFTSDRTSADDLPPGMPEGFFIIERAAVPRPGFSQTQMEETFTEEEIARLKLKPDDVPVPVALRLLFPGQFGSNTRARKESRKRRILVHRGPLVKGEGGKEAFDREKLYVGKVGDRVRPGDTIAIQTRMTHKYDSVKDHDDEPPFILPVVYEDDHFAVVDKPENIIVFGHKNGGFGRHTVRSCLPWALTPPKAGVISVMRRPQPVHRIDRGTSGLLVCAKTKPAMVEIARMFKERKVKKTYTAIVNGDIKEPKESSISSKEAEDLGVCIGKGEVSSEDASWQLIEEELEGQSAVTIWRALQKWPLENARNSTVTKVELKPKTGRFHQLRRHMAWVSKCPLLGDKEYDGGGLAKTLRDKGFYLCSNRVTLEHPYYNSPQGRPEWELKKETLLGEKEGGNVCITEEKDGSVLVHCEIDLPPKFSEIGG